MSDSKKQQSESVIIKQRRQKAKELEELGIRLYPNNIKRSEIISAIHRIYDPYDNEALSKLDFNFRVAGRIMALRRFGKATFFDIHDHTGKMQIHVQRDTIGKDEYKIFKKFDIGDIVEAEGKLFKTKTGELTIEAERIKLVTKSLYPLPEKYHGLTDKELRYRHRYLDLIMNPEVRETFRKRSKIIQLVREYFTSNGFLEVETPMMQTIVGGATARPFITHHNALDIDLFLRIAPELCLKRLLVGHMDKVFELNRNFRNEGISVQHNPEFTMLEFYESYATYEDLIIRTEELFEFISKELNNEQLVITYQGEKISFERPWKRMTMKEALVEIGKIPADDLKKREKLISYAKELDLPITGQESIGKLWAKLFDELVEPKLIQPTFITHYPIDISPLARRNEQDPSVTDRFELFIAGREIANAFSELNDPRDQLARFEEQIKNRGDDEEIPPEIDYDFIRALEIGMPPAAGEGIGIDRLVMLFTDSASIRDVILFPLLKPIQK